MVDDPKTAADDESLAIRIMCGDREALREVLEEHLQQTRDLLTTMYHTTLHPGEINEAISAAVLKLLKYAHQYNKTKGGIGGWFFTMAQTAALDIIRREKRYRRRHRHLGSEDEPFVDYPVEVDGEPLTKEENHRLRDLNDIIEKKLTGLQQAIVKADLAAGEPADAGRLAEMYQTTKNSIYVSRNKAHGRIKKEMMELEQRRERFRGKQ
jgi:RNA polymerase sigma factor (sigma-70 family)